jgi:hypothetical protein
MSEELTPRTLGQIVQAAIVQLEPEISYGKYFPMSQLKQLAGAMGQDETKFAFFKLSLISAFRERGFWLNEKGLNGEGMRIALALENFYYAESATEKAIAGLDRATVLLTKTDLTGLSEAEVKRHENTLRQTQHQRLMLLRSEEVTAVIRKHKPALLRPDIEIFTESV